MIRNVSLHNEDEIRRKDIRVGDTVLIERAGDVIPYVVQVVTSRRPAGRADRFRFPRRCPACRARSTLRPEGEAYWRCVRSACPAQLKERLRHFGSRRGHEHRAPGRRDDRRSSSTAGSSRDVRRSLSAVTADEAGAPRGIRAASRRRISVRAIAAIPHGAVSRACSTGWGSDSSARTWRACWPRGTAAWTGSPRRPSGISRPFRASGRRSPSRSRGSSPTGATAASFGGSPRRG